MAIIKYYRLESRAKDAVDSLTASLQKRMLSEKTIAGLLSSHIEDTIEAEAKAIRRADAKEQLHDTEEFQTLYRQTSTISKGYEGKRKFFGRNIPNIPPKYSTELVVKGEASDIMLFQAYLADSKFDVIEAKTVSKAAFSFGTVPTCPNTAAICKKHIEETVKKENKGLELKIAISENIIWDGKNGDSCACSLQGGAEQVLQLRQIISSMANTYGSPIKSEIVQFY